MHAVYFIIFILWSSLGSTLLAETISTVTLSAQPSVVEKEQPNDTSKTELPVDITPEVVNLPAEAVLTVTSSVLPSTVAEKVQLDKPKEAETTVPAVPVLPSGSLNEVVSTETSQVQITAASDVDEIKGIDTVDISEPKGNWLLKRIWWERAERLYEKIKQVVQKIIDSRMFFFQKRTEFDRTIFDPFYINIGVGQGELQEIIASIFAFIEKVREEKGSFNEKQRELIQSLDLERDSLEAMKQKLQSVSALDNKIDDAIMQLAEQINRVRDYEQKAWDLFTAITRELSDKHARELYYSMDNIWKNIQTIDTYIKEQFASYFNQLTENAQALIKELDATVTALKEKGIDLKLQVQQLLEPEEKTSMLKEKAKEESDNSIEDEPAQQQQGWFSWVISFFEFVENLFTTAIAYVTSFFRSVPTEKVNKKDQGDIVKAAKTTS